MGAKFVKMHQIDEHTARATLVNCVKIEKVDIQINTEMSNEKILAAILTHRKSKSVVVPPASVVPPANVAPEDNGVDVDLNKKTKVELLDLYSKLKSEADINIPDSSTKAEIIAAIEMLNES